jgi:ABC-type antimicrobial peptide transport system permease subunit
MKFLLSVILIAVFSAVAEYFLPWWTIAVVCFLVALFLRQSAGKSFLIGFCGVGVFWLAAAMLHDVANEHILSARMAALFHLPNYGLFILVTVFVGGLIGGLSACTAALLRPKVN